MRLFTCIIDVPLVTPLLETMKRCDEFEICMYMYVAHKYMYLCSDAITGGVDTGNSSGREGRGGSEGGSGEHGLPQLHLVDVCQWTNHLQWVDRCAC